MKRIERFFGIAAMVAAIGFMAACGGNGQGNPDDPDPGPGPGEPTITGIAVTQNPAKVVYAIGEAADWTGLVVTATYSDATTRTIAYPNAGLDITGLDSATAGQRTITVTYMTRTATFNVTVEGAAAQTFTVTFDSAGGSAVPSQTVTDGETAAAPANPARAFAPAAGLYLDLPEALAYAFDHWSAPGTTTPFNFATPITADITLTAQWTAPAATPVPDVEANDLQAVLNHVNANAADGHFTWLLGEDIAVAGLNTRGLNQTDARLTIIGLGQERVISVTSNGRIFTLGAAGETGISLTLGNNIALVGLNATTTPATNTNGLVQVTETAALTMLAGSEIRGNTSSGNTAAANWGAALHVQDAGSFTMLGGSITGNHSTVTASTFRGGGMRADSDAVITLAGGSITGNTAVWGGDILVWSSAASFAMSGTAAVGTIMLHATAAARCLLTVAADWTGTVAGLDLASNSLSVDGTIGWWNDNDVLIGPGVNAANIARITLGNFVTGTASEAGRQPIAPTHHINAEGVLVENE